MASAPKYAKRLPEEGAARAPRSPDANPVLRLTLGEMPLEDALELPLHLTDPSGTLGDLLDGAFPTGPDQQAEAVSLLDTDENPDAPEMYAELSGLMSDWRSGRCALRFFVNHGPEIEPSDDVAAHLGAGPSQGAAQGRTALLDLVIEQRHTPLDYAVRAGYWTDRRQLLDWLQESTQLLYANVSGQLGPGRGVPFAEAARRLADDGLLGAAPDTEDYFPSDAGEQALAGMMDEGESHTERYDVFADVLHAEESERPLFGTGLGGDLRVAVCEAEGLDPVRTVYLLRMYDFSLEESLGEWLEAEGSEEFFNRLLEPAVDRWSVDEATLELIIEAGLAHAEELEEARLAGVARRVALRRAGPPAGP